MKKFFDSIFGDLRSSGCSRTRLVAFGDSVTQGVMEQHLIPGGCAYHTVLQQMLEAVFPIASFSTINSGAAGESAYQALKRIGSDVLALQPDLTIVAFGLNDSLAGRKGLAHFKKSLETIIARIKGETSSEIILMTPPPMATKINASLHGTHRRAASKIILSQNSGMLRKYSEVIIAVAASEEVHVVDVYAHFDRLRSSGLDCNLFLVNGLNHPNALGHKLIAAIIFSFIMSSFNRGDLI